MTTDKPLDLAPLYFDAVLSQGSRVRFAVTTEAPRPGDDGERYRARGDLSGVKHGARGSSVTMAVYRYALALMVADYDVVDVVRDGDPSGEQLREMLREESTRRVRSDATHAAMGAQIAEMAAEVQRLRADNERLTRACVEGLPREVLHCPACGVQHIEGPRHDNPTLDGRVRPHHTHRCYGCGHVWDAGRWSYGDTEASVAAPLSEVQRLRDIILGWSIPPNDAQIEAHAAAGGRWLIATRHPDDDDGGAEAPCVFVLDHGTLEPAAYRVNSRTIRWWALDASGAPTQWPVAK